MRRPGEHRGRRPRAARACAVLLAAGLAAGCGADRDGGGPDDAAPPPPPPPAPAALAADALTEFLAEREIREVPTHRDAFADLDGDGRDDLLMLLEDPNWCGSGGCTLLVFHHAGDRYELVTETSVTHPPIAISRQRHGGWLDLLVNVGGGGLEPGTVVLQHDGTGYPPNPSLMAAMAPDALPSARVVIE